MAVAERAQAGLTRSLSRRTVNFKASWTRITKDDAPERDQALLRLQISWY